MSYVDLTAPFDGIITKKWADVGDLATPGKPLAAMEDPSALQMLADVPEALIANVSLGDHLPIHLATITNDILGTIAEISPVADPKSRTSLVKLDLPDEPGLRSGQFGRVAVPLGTASAIWVPTAAVIQRGQMELVFVLAGGQAQLRLVKTGNRIGDEIELVSGLNAGEQIVTAGAAVLTDGQPVTLQP
jgi:RND family efflux transporter MFP subunit